MESIEKNSFVATKIAPFLLPIRSVVFLLIFVLGALIVKKDIADISNWWSIVATCVNALTILLLILIARLSGMNYWKLLNFQKGATKVWQVFLIIFVMLLVGMGGMYLAGFACYGVIPYAAPMMIDPIPKFLAIVNVLLLPISTAFAEDGLYLGCGVNQIKNKFIAIFVPAFFFALQHCFIPTLFDVRYLLYRFFSFLPLTIILCWYYYKKRNPLPIMIGHAIIDFATVMQILATSTIPGLMQCGM